MSDIQPVVQDQTPLPENTGAQQKGMAPQVQTVAHVNGQYEHSEQIDKLIESLAAAQLRFEPLFKETDNPYYHSKYADLAAIIKSTQKALASEGLVLIQLPIVDIEAQKAGVVTLLGHKSGQWMKNTLILPAVMLGRDGKPRFDAQSVGSALTYARRYGRQSILDVAADVDDDANTAVGIGSKEASQAVGATKTAQLKEKVKAQKGEPVMAVFYVLHEESNTFEITVPEDLKRASWPILKRFWDGGAKAIVVPANDFDDVKFELERANIWSFLSPG